MNPSDKRLFELISKSGADISKPRTIAHYLYFPYKADAVRAGEVFKRNGYQVDVQYAESGDDWLVLAEKLIFMDEHIINEERSLCERTSFEHNGVYDGWETDMG